MQTNGRRMGVAIVMLGLGVLVNTTAAHWDPGDPHKMEMPLLPDPTGWDVCLACQDIADDFVCAESGPITDIHFWISWRQDHVGEVPDSAWNIYIFDDQGGRPGSMLWQYTWDGNIATRWYGQGEQGWVCPSPPRYTNRPDHQQFFQVNITDIQNAFVQVEGTTYWLVIRALIPHSWPVDPIVGWKTSADFPVGSSGYGAPAMWSNDGWETWYEVETEMPWEAWHDMAFVIDGGWPRGACCYEEYDTMQCAPDMTELDCQDIYRGTWMGEGTDCHDSDYNGIADACEENLGACCFEESAGHTQCAWLPEWRYDECEELYAGTWMGYGTNCDDVSPPNGIADVCEDAFNTDFGDAPDGAVAYPSTGVIGSFPTCINGTGYDDFVRHQVDGVTSVCFGGMRDTESDGNGGLCPGFAPYDNDECWDDGDAGLLFPSSSTIQGGVVVSCDGEPVPPLGQGCMIAQWGRDIDILVENFSDGNAYVNVLFDWNQDGYWYGSSQCPGGSIAWEHALQNYLIQPGFSGHLSQIDPVNPPPDFPIGPNGGYVWVRFSITETPVTWNWCGAGEFENGETEDYLLWVLPRAPLESKWLQAPENPQEEFDAPSNLWFPQGGDQIAKWDQTPVNTLLDGVYAYDYRIGPDNIKMIVADDWLCEGSVVTGFRWYGTVENPGAGIQSFHLSIHDNVSDTCLPLDLPEGTPIWVEDIPISAITVISTGQFNSAGLEIFEYEYRLPEVMWFYQTEGERYWFDVSAVSLNLDEPYVWLWAERMRMQAPFHTLCPASQIIYPFASVWQWLDWGDETYSDMAFKVMTTEARDYEPNRVVADDWVCDGRPVNGVRWWGSYIDPVFMPEEPQGPHIIDGWLISFHHDVEQDCPPDFAAGDHPTALGLYWAPADAVEINALDMQDCMEHSVYEYRVDLTDCCLLCQHSDPRDGSVPAERGQFSEVQGFRYWLDIQAVVGAEWINDGFGGCQLELTGHLPPAEPPFDFWGWHTSQGPQGACDQDNRQACTGNLTDFDRYPSACWLYENWEKQPYLCPGEERPVHMAFELLTIDPAPCPTCEGDVNEDGLVDGRDIQCFVNCLIHGPTGTCNCACADFNCTMTPDMDDIDGFVDRLLNSMPPCS